LLLLGTFAWRAARQRRRSTPWWLALTVTLKPWLVPLVLVEWRTALRTIAIGLVGVLVGVWLCGLSNWTAWFSTMSEHDVWPTPSNLGLFAAALRFSGQVKYGSEVASPAFVRPVWLASSAVVFLATSAVTWWERPDTDRLWLLWILAALLISPISWTYYLLVLLGPLAAWGEQRHWPIPVRIALVLWIVPVWLVNQLLIAGFPLLGSIYTLAALLLWSSACLPTTSAPLILDTLPADT
jgi:hypothetical protein